jgi:hypothetical protein
LEAGALEAEQRGERVAGPLDDARRQVAAHAELLAAAERGEALAEAAVKQALTNARIQLAPVHHRRIVALLDELEVGLWRVRDLQRALHGAVTDAFGEEISIGISAAHYWDFGFPGFPYLRQDEEILTWLRHRSIAPRNRSLRQAGKC